MPRRAAIPFFVAALFRGFLLVRADPTKRGGKPRGSPDRIASAWGKNRPHCAGLEDNGRHAKRSVDVPNAIKPCRGREPLSPCRGSAKKPQSRRFNRRLNGFSLDCWPSGRQERQPWEGQRFFGAILKAQNGDPAPRCVSSAQGNNRVNRDEGWPSAKIGMVRPCLPRAFPKVFPPPRPPQALSGFPKRIGGHRPKRGEGSGPRAKRLGPRACEAAVPAQRKRRAPSGPCASIESGGGAPRGPVPEPLRSGGGRGRRGARPVGATIETPRVAPTLRRSRASTLGVGSRRRYRASLSSKGAKTPSLRMQVWPWDSNRGRSRLLTASISW